jgi:hypothetical protein
MAFGEGQNHHGQYESIEGHSTASIFESRLHDTSSNHAEESITDHFTKPPVVL